MQQKKESILDLSIGEKYMHTATPSGRFCGRKWTRSEASGQFS